MYEYVRAECYINQFPCPVFEELPPMHLICKNKFIKNLFGVKLVFNGFSFLMIKYIFIEILIVLSFFIVKNVIVPMHLNAILLINYCLLQ